MTFNSFNGVSIIISLHAQLCKALRIVLELFLEQSDILILKGRGESRNNISEENI